MWSGIREEISPAILAVATVLLAFALLFMATVEWLRRRGDKTTARLDPKRGAAQTGRRETPHGGCRNRNALWT